MEPEIPSYKYISHIHFQWKIWVKDVPSLCPWSKYIRLSIIEMKLRTSVLVDSCSFQKGAGFGPNAEKDSGNDK